MTRPPRIFDSATEAEAPPPEQKRIRINGWPAALEVGRLGADLPPAPPGAITFPCVGVWVALRID